MQSKPQKRKVSHNRSQSHKKNEKIKAVSPLASKFTLKKESNPFDGSSKNHKKDRKPLKKGKPIKLKEPQKKH